MLPGGEILYEGVCNREIVNRLAEKCHYAGIKYKLLVPSSKDISSRRRAEVANQFCDDIPNCVFVSIRLNKNQKEAYQGFSNSQGISVSYYRKNQKFWIWDRLDKTEQTSQQLAHIFLHFLHQGTGMHKRGVKMSKHLLLRNLQMPAIISRCGYLNHLEDSQKLLSPDFREYIANAHFEAIKFVENLGFNQLHKSESLLQTVQSGGI